MKGKDHLEALRNNGRLIWK